MKRKIKLFANCSIMHYIKRPLFIFEIKVTKYAPIILEKPWKIEWTYEEYGWTQPPFKWHDKMLWTQPTELGGYKVGTSLNTHNWMQFLASRAYEIAHFRKYPITPTECTFYFFGKKILSWKV